MTDSSPASQNALEVEQLSQNLSREWAFDKRIVIFSIRDVSRTTIKVWAEALLETLSAWPAGHPFLALFDLSFPEATLTPYLRTRLSEIMDSQRNLTGRTAVVMQKTFLANLAQLFLRNRKQGIRQRQLFFSREEGMIWLRQALE